MIKTKQKKIDKFSYKLLDTKKLKPEEIQGYDLFPEIYSNVLFCARKKSGKTTCLYNSVMNSVGKDADGNKTKLYFFVGTLNKDDSYKQMIEKLDKKDYDVETYTSFFDEQNKNILTHIMKEYDEILMMEEEIKEKEKEEMENKKEQLNLDGYTVVVKNKDKKIQVKMKKKGKTAPRFIFVFDDISNELRNNKAVRKLVKENRHYKSKVFISTQDIYDLYPDSREMLDVMILFKKIKPEKITNIYNSIQCDISDKQFNSFYHYATEDTKDNTHNFFYVDTNNCTYRKNFDTELSF